MAKLQITATQNARIGWLASQQPAFRSLRSGTSFAVVFVVAIASLALAVQPVHAVSSWVATQNMVQIPRTAAPAVTLPNGKVLVAGGNNPFSGRTTECELYDPTTGTWSVTGAMNFARSAHTLTLLPDGTVLAAGGNGNNDAETYDPATGAWTPTANAMNAPYGSSTATLLPSGKVLFAGGHDTGPLTDIYNPITRTFSDGPSMVTSPIRELPVAVLLNNGTVLIAGGGNFVAALTSAEVFDPTANTFTAVSSMTTGRIEPGGALLPNGKVLLAGGYGTSGQIASAEIYDPVANTWTTTASMSAPRNAAPGMPLIALTSGHVLFAGQSVSSATSEEYDPATGMWVNSTVLPRSVCDGAQALLQDGGVLLATGFDCTTQDSSTVSTAAFVYMPIAAPQLSALAPANVWIGLKNSDDVGVKFDLKAEVYKDGTLVSSGELDSFAGGSSGFNNAHLASIPFDSFSPILATQGSQLSIKLYVRNACTGSTHNSGIARLWFNDAAADSRFGATIAGTASSYYLRDLFALATTAGSGPKKTIDVQSGAKCSAFKSFGTWSVTL